MVRSVSPAVHPVHYFRLARGFSLRELAGVSGVDFRRLSVIERGFDASEIRRLARALGCDEVHLVRPGTPRRGLS